MLDYRYNTFITLSTLLSYTKTAQSLNMTQPAVTQHIQYLEQIYHCKLFKKDGKNISLTDQGNQLQKFVTRMISDAHQIKKTISGIKNKKEIIFGATLTIGQFVMPKVISKLSKDGYKVKMIIENTSMLLNRLQKGEIQVAVIEGYFDKNLYGYELLRNEKFIGICSSDNILSKKFFSIHDIFDNNLIIRENGSGSREILEHALYEKNYSIDSFTNIIEINNISVIKEMVKSDCGISFMYECAIGNDISKIRLQDFRIEKEFNFVYMKDTVLLDEVLKIISEIKG